MDDERYAFVVEWYEEIAGRTRQFQFFYYVNSKCIEMFDLKTRKVFLRTSVKDNEITLPDLFIGGSINILGRKLTIIDYGEEYTRRKLSEKKEKTLGMIKPDGVEKLGQILDEIYKRGFLLTRLRMCCLDRNQAFRFYEEHRDKPFFNALIDYITSGPIIVFEIVNTNAVDNWREAIGPTDPSRARTVAPTSIRAQYGIDVTRNVVHGSDSAASAVRELEFFFPSSGPMLPNTSKGGNCTCCLIKPHAVKAGKIISAITEAGFRIGAAQMMVLEKANAEEFLEVYKGVVHEYNGMVAELTAGACIALEVLSDTQNTVQVFRELAGPADPEIARHLRPRTLRAIFGVDKVKNAVHCTDLPEDGQLEDDYFFKILDR
ncbi:nucleoside diphosphate kinase 7-like isoform X2 [Pomacea canaliculata]|uniref:nucleoside diphosphate kinase 7-like isoform X2 n=1 Tax=Pomacea canaliculata TaxID=400727 RepID=UPI000D731A90|nr:nucleoside diphosphate kinase 7-like isoform X2 [Pomacea canaliculata]